MSTTMASPSLRAASATTTFVNALTIDVEDYFQVSAFAPHIDRDNWPAMECRIEQNVDRILAMLADANARATFFTLGWVAERYPALIQRIADCGHELASHGYSHQRATDQTPQEFRSDITLAKAIIEDIAGVEVRGYRAPSFSIGDANTWAFDAIAARDERGSSQVAVVRVEQLYPWPYGGVEAIVSSYPNADELVWLQEEPENMGAWNFVKGKLYEHYDDTHQITRISRYESGSPATASRLGRMLASRSIEGPRAAVASSPGWISTSRLIGV